MIGEDNNIYIMPCGEPCDEAPIGISPPQPTDDDDSTPPETTDDDGSTPPETTDDDDSTITEIPDDDDRTSTYQYIGCYGDDNKQRVLTGMVLDHFDEMTTEVRRGS